MNPGSGNATITVGSGTGTVAAGVANTISANTTRADLRVVVSITDQGPPVGTPVTTTIIPAGNGDFSHTIPGANMVAGHTYAVNIKVHPDDGASPPHGESNGTISVSSDTGGGGPGGGD